jgi:hypothetical protein
VIARASQLRIVVTGLITQHPLLGGMTWHYLHYVLGLRRIGHDVYYIEDSGEWPYNLDGGASGEDFSAATCDGNVEYPAEVMRRFGLEGRWAYHSPIDDTWFGLSSQKRKTVIESADLLLNVSGTIPRPEEFRRIRTLAYIDTDPVFTQITLARGQQDLRRVVDFHDVQFSFGECLPGMAPSTGHQWYPTRQPVVLTEWRPSLPCRDAFTTIMNWASYEPESYQGRRYGQKDVEFSRFLDLPGRVAPAVLEIAGRGMRTDPLRTAENWNEAGSVSARLAAAGWRVASAVGVCADFESYRRYIEFSKAEWSVAKNAYVAARCGWFSDRSACYLAAGRPVVVQDTGFGAVLPVGEGILTFANMDEAVAAIQEIQADYERHRLAARAIAEEYFDSSKVLSRLVEQAMNGGSHSVSDASDSE